MESLHKLSPEKSGPSGPSRCRTQDLLITSQTLELCVLCTCMYRDEFLLTLTVPVTETDTLTDWNVGLIAVGVITLVTGLVTAIILGVKLSIIVGMFSHVLYTHTLYMYMHCMSTFTY